MKISALDFHSGLKFRIRFKVDMCTFPVEKPQQLGFSLFYCNNEPFVSFRVNTRGVEEGMGGREEGKKKG